MREGVLLTVACSKLTVLTLAVLVYTGTRGSESIKPARLLHRKRPLPRIYHPSYFMSEPGAAASAVAEQQNRLSVRIVTVTAAYAVIMQNTNMIRNSRRNQRKNKKKMCTTECCCMTIGQ